MALRKTLLPRSGYPEGFTGLQQRLVLHILTHQPFDSYRMATGSAIFVHGLRQMKELLLLIKRL
jgi:hypothetical protein